MLIDIVLFLWTPLYYMCTALNSFQSAFTHGVSGETSPGRSAHMCFFYCWESLLSAKSFCPVPGSSPWGPGPVIAASHRCCFGIWTLHSPCPPYQNLHLYNTSRGIHAHWSLISPGFLHSLFFSSHFITSPFSPLSPFSLSCFSQLQVSHSHGSDIWNTRLTWFFVSAFTFIWQARILSQ